MQMMEIIDPHHSIASFVRCSFCLMYCTIRCKTTKRSSEPQVTEAASETKEEVKVVLRLKKPGESVLLCIGIVPWIFSVIFRKITYIRMWGRKDASTFLCLYLNTHKKMERLFRFVGWFFEAEECWLNISKENKPVPFRRVVLGGYKKSSWYLSIILWVNISNPFPLAQMIHAILANVTRDWLSR